MMEVALSADVAGLATAVAGLCEGFEGPSAREGACIAAGVTAVGVCVRRNENGACGGAECVVARGAE
jgi:hypothetical protein